MSLRRAFDIAEILANPEGTRARVRPTALRAEWDDIVVDTCETPDCGWETGISTDKDSNYTIVEEYENEDKARQGHERWIQIMKNNPRTELKDCRDAIDWFFGV